MPTDWSRLGEVWAARIQFDGGKMLTPAQREQLRSEGVAVPYTGSDKQTGEIYAFYDDRQIKDIQTGKLTKTTYVDAEFGKRSGDSPIVTTPKSTVATTAASSMRLEDYAAIPSGGVVPSGQPNDPHPFAGTNFEEIAGMGIVVMVMLMGFKIVSGLFGGRR